LNEVKCSNIENTVCLPTLSDEMFYCISIEQDEIGTLNNVNFNVDNNNPNYVVGQPILIKKIEISYDYIGLITTTASNTEIVINKETFNLTPTLLYNVSFIKASPIYLFNELNGTIDLQLPLCRNEVESKIRLRAIERNREFQVSNLKIVASGFIGGNSFTATADISGLVTPNTNVIPLNRLAISNITFAGNICWLNKMNRINLNEHINSNLTIEFIEPTSNYCEPLIKGNPGRFLGDVDVSFIANEKIFITSA